MKHLDRTNFLEALGNRGQPWHAGYYAMYSSLLDGVVTDPSLMLLPIDDHLVHRGDGVFETGKCVDGAIYNFDAHLRRLQRSGAAIGLAWPGGQEEIMRLSCETIRAGGHRDCSLRIILARGPGSLGINPYDSPNPALYIMAYDLGATFMSSHPAGAVVRRSLVPPKAPFFASIKNCNYLPNAMMKREVVDWEVDFVVGFDAAGNLAEGPTENFGIVTSAGELAFPRLDNILAGTTMLRVLELARALVKSGELTAVTQRDIVEQEIVDAEEILIVGTTLNLVAACVYEQRPIGGGRPGAVYASLSRMLDEDIASNTMLLTPVFA